MNCCASSVSTGATCTPASTSWRQTSTALYAAMPPHTPRTTRGTTQPLSGGIGRLVARLGRDDGLDLGRFHGRGFGGSDLFGIDALVHDLALSDFLERDRERLARHRRHLGRDDAAETLAELVVVVVDLAGAHGGQRDERELRVDLPHQL